MGASGWDYVIDYDDDVQAALVALQERVLAADEFYWDDGDDGDDDPFPGPKPTSLQELAAMKDDEESDFWEVGTHSILDLDRVIGPGDEDHDGTLRPLDDDVVERTFGTLRPSREQFEQAHAADSAENEFPFARKWSGLYLVLYTDDRPTGIAIWGYSGD